MTASTCSPAGRVTRSLLGYGILAGPVYVAVSLAQAATRDGFDLRRHAWSLLSNGSLGWLQGMAFASRRIDQGAFAVVKVGDLEGVPVSLSNQVVATTGDDGRALVTGLLPYQLNQLTVNPDQLPMGVDIRGVRETVVPYARSGAFIEFPVKRSRDVLVVLLGEVARSYADLRGFQLRLDIAEKNIRTQEDTVHLTQTRAAAGLATQLDVSRAVAELETTNAVVPSLRSAIAASIHRISVLLGQEPAALENELETSAPVPVVPPEVPVGLPSDLLKRRPDVRRADDEIAGAAANVKAARADYFPKFTLLGSAGRQATQLHDLSLSLGNFFAGISLHADRPFQVGDVIVVGQQKITGVVEGITWRAVKIRTFQNHVLLVSNSNAAKEAIEVCPRESLNARLVFFGTLYSDFPAKTIHVVREAVRDADNVSQKITPIVRIRDFGESSIDWEVKYWLDDYAKYNDTDALVRQRIWYAFRRANINFAFPTRTLHVERKSAAPAAIGPQREIIERLSAVDIFSPLSPEEIEKLAGASMRHIFAPGEFVIRAGDEGASMFVVHNGRVQVQVNDAGQARPVAMLGEGAFFGEMALFTGEPRTANVVALEETEVLEIGHAAMKHLFDTNPDLAESISWTIAERRAGLEASSQLASQVAKTESEGLLASIVRFFGLREK